jgi:hypothetical protein
MNDIEELIRRINIFFPAKLRPESTAALARIKAENIMLRTKLHEQTVAELKAALPTKMLQVPLPEDMQPVKEPDVHDDKEKQRSSGRTGSTESQHG